MQTTETIFDSRIAKTTYSEHDYYKSGTFTVPAGHVALVEMTTKHDYFDKITFTAVRQPRPVTGQDCLNVKGIGKAYSQVECGNDLGIGAEPTSNNSVITPLTKARWRLGKDAHNKVTHEYRYILRPGNYYLVAKKEGNMLLECCDAPTIVEVSVFPANHTLAIHQVCTQGE